MPIFGKDDGGSIFQYGFSGHHYHVNYHEGPDVPPVVGVGSATGLRSHKVAVFENEQPNGTGFPFTDAQVKSFGQAYDLISSQVANPHWTSHYTSAQVGFMRAANSGLKLLIYTNSGEDANGAGTTYPDAYYAHDANGNKLENVRWGTWPMQPDNSGWMSAVLALAQARRNTSDTNSVSIPFDGIFADVLGDSALFTTDVNKSPTPPVNPVTGAKYTSAQWYAMTSVLAAQHKTATGSGYTVVNGISTGQKYFSASRKLLTVSGAPEAALCESFVRVAGTPFDITDGDGYPPDQINPTTGKPGTATATATSGAQSWKACLNMIQDANSAAVNKTLICTTKDWTTAPDPTRTARMQFGFATFLLVDNGTNYFCASGSQLLTMTALPWLSYTDYGTALGAATTDANGCYYRSFTKSSIGVNPTSAAHSMTVGGQTTTVQPYRAVFVFS